MPTATSGLGARVRQLREWRGLSQEELAEKIGKDQNYISQLERGVIRMPRPETLAALAEALGTTPVDLLRAAGWVPEEPRKEPLPPHLEFFAGLERELTEEDWEVLREFAEFLLTKRRRLRHP